MTLKNRLLRITHLLFVILLLVQLIGLLRKAQGGDEQRQG